MRELITIQVGQCGNQIGREFWKTALEEHAKYTKDGLFDESMSSFFRNVDSRYDDPIDLPFENGTTEIKCLKARAILVDMEQGPISETLNGPLGELFDNRQFITDVSGSGNNWAHGYGVYGPKYHDALVEQLRHATELCDSLQSFFLLHSLGGGTGSGLGTYILSILQDEYPQVYRFTTSVFPSNDDDVITSPYNSVLALKELTERADCVLPIENQALMEMSTSEAVGNKSSDVFANMNHIVATVLTGLTSSMRFEGSLNVDLNEITTNLVPYPKLHYIMSSISPITKDHRQQPRRIDQVFNDVFRRENQLISANPKSGTVLACGLLLRGNVPVSDISRNIKRLQSELSMIYWNQEGFKVGVCATPSLDQPRSLLCLSNNCIIKNTFQEMYDRFVKLYRRKAHVHHYLDFVQPQVFQEAVESIQYLIAEYTKLEQAQPPVSRTRRRYASTLNR